MKTKKNFSELSKSGFISEQENAIDAMFSLIQKKNYPQNLRVETVEELKSEIENGSPKIGDMIARNPKNHEDQWLVAEQYFNDNFEPIQ